MTTYRVVYDVIVDADSEAEALDEARALIRNPHFEADTIEVMD